MLPIGNRGDLGFSEAQLTAERGAEILSPDAADERRRPKLCKHLQVHRHRPPDRNPALHRQLAEEGRFVVPGRSIGRRNGRSASTGSQQC